MGHWDRKTKAELVAEVERLSGLLKAARLDANAIRADERQRCKAEAEKWHSVALNQASESGNRWAAAQEAAHPLERVATKLQLQGAIDSLDRAEAWAVVRMGDRSLTAADVARIVHALGMMGFPPAWLRDDDEEAA